MLLLTLMHMHTHIKEQLSKTDAEQQRMRDQQQQISQEQKEIISLISKLKSKKKSFLDSYKKDEIKELESKIKTVSIELVRDTSNLSNLQEIIQSEHTKENELATTNAKLTQRIDLDNSHFSALEEQKRQLESEAEKAKMLQQESERIYESALTGAEIQDSTAKSWADQVKDAQKEATEAARLQQEHQQKISQYREFLDLKKKELNKMSKNTDDLQNKQLSSAFQAAKSRVEQFERRADALETAIQRDGQITQELEQLEGKRRACQKSVDQLRQPVSKYEFYYKEPEARFDPNRVKGIAAKLFSPLNPARDSLALEVAAGGKLYSVIIDTPETGSLLFRNGALHRSYNLIPLSKIKQSRVSAEKLQRAKQLVGDENAELALNLVGFEASLSPAMVHIFGSTIICATADAAKTVAFDKSVHVRAVTLAGDLYDPHGTLTGGSRERNQVLPLFTLLRDEEQKLSQLCHRLCHLEQEKASIQHDLDEYQKFQLAKHELALIETSQSQTSLNQLKAQIEELESQLQLSIQLQQENRDREAAAKDREQELQRSKNKSNDSEDSKMKALEQRLRSSKQQSNVAAKAFNKINQDVCSHS